MFLASSQYRQIGFSIFILLTILLTFSAPASAKEKRLKFDLINMEPCKLAKGRLQEEPDNAVIQKVVAAGKAGVPVLIEMLTDNRATKHPVICLWGRTAVGDIAFVILLDLFQDSAWKPIVPEATWDALLDKCDPALPSSVCLYDFVKKNGRKEVQTRWRQLWEKYKDQLFWDENERCLKLQSGISGERK